jgi:hypothetical protein
LAALGFCACAESETNDPATLERRDSVGISIVEVADLSGVDTLLWRVDANAAITIGVSDGDAPYLFTSIGGVARLDDGRIVVADRGTDQVRFFDSSGRFLKTVGGTGDGPLEYRSIDVLKKIQGDSLVVVDREGGRITVLDSAGSLVRRYLMAPLGTDEVPAPAWAVFYDGSQLTIPNGGTEVIAPGVMEMRALFRRVRDGGQLVAEYEGAIQVLRFVQASIAGPEARGGGEPLARWSAGEQAFVFAPDPRVSEWRMYSSRGAVDRIIRVTGPNPWVVASDTARMGTFTSDRAGDFWVQVTQGEEGVAPPWLVVAADGQSAHAIRLPPVTVSSPARRYPVMEIGDDYVLMASVNPQLAPVVLWLPIRKAAN